MSQKKLNSEELETRLQFYKLKAEHLEKQLAEKDRELCLALQHIVLNEARAKFEKGCWACVALAEKEKEIKELKAKLDIDSFPEISHRAVYEEVNGIEFEKLDEFIYTVSPIYTAVFQPCDEKTLNEIKKDTEELWQKETGLKLIHAYYMYVPDLYDEHVWRLLPRYYFVKGE